MIWKHKEICETRIDDGILVKLGALGGQNPKQTGKMDILLYWPYVGHMNRII